MKRNKLTELLTMLNRYNIQYIITKAGNKKQKYINIIYRSLDFIPEQFQGRELLYKSPCFTPTIKEGSAEVVFDIKRNEIYFNTYYTNLRYFDDDKYSIKVLNNNLINEYDIPLDVVVDSIYKDWLVSKQMVRLKMECV